jgi:Trk K+ transport system NAD-binding subunit
MLLRDLRLPPDVLFLEITRNGHAIVPNGHTHLHLKDDVTLLGQPDSLDELTRRIGF